MLCSVFFAPTQVKVQGKFQLLDPCAPVVPHSQRKIHTRGNIWSFTVGWHEYCDPTGGAGAVCNVPCVCTSHAMSHMLGAWGSPALHGDDTICMLLVVSMLAIQFGVIAVQGAAPQAVNTTGATPAPHPANSTLRPAANATLRPAANRTGKENSSCCLLRPRTTPFPEYKSILGVIYGVLLWADRNAATPLGGAGVLCK